MSRVAVPALVGSLACLGTAGTVALDLPTTVGLATAVAGAAATAVLGARAHRAEQRQAATVREGLAALHRGDLSRSSTDDVVGSALASLVERLRPVAGSVELLGIAGQEMGLTGRTISDGARDTAASAVDLATASDDVSEKVAALAAAGEQMQAAISEIARSASLAVGSAAEGVDAVVVAEETMGALERSSDRVGHVARAITDIAEQTNLLALNATIEAARAGEAGKGFAVVAGEVKDLARETARATDEVAETVAQIQGDTASAIAAIRTVRGLIDAISEFQHSIAAAVEEQTLSTQSMTATTTDLARQASTIASSTATVAELASRTSTAALRSHRVVDELTRITTGLRSSTGQMHLPAPEKVPGGFEIAWDRAANRLQFTEWGDWDLEVAKSFSRDLTAAIGEHRPGWTVLCDMSRMGPTTPDVQEVIEETMGVAARAQMAFAVIVLQDPLVAMQMQRSSEAQGAPIAYASSRSEAEALLAAR
ncbi:MAG: methyl-accepting chemotaxis protein [Quadrisphaera sp.]